jgi:hypothetical protein
MIFCFREGVAFFLVNAFSKKSDLNNRLSTIAMTLIENRTTTTSRTTLMNLIKSKNSKGST